MNDRDADEKEREVQIPRLIALSSRGRAGTSGRIHCYPACVHRSSSSFRDFIEILRLLLRTT